MSDLMDFGSYVQFLFALVFVLGLIGLFSLLLKRLSMNGVAGLRSGRGERRLKVVETVMVDGKRRMVLVRRDNREHLLLLGQQNDLLIESNIEADEDAATPAEQAGSPGAARSSADITALGTDLRRMLRGDRQARQ